MASVTEELDFKYLNLIYLSLDLSKYVWLAALDRAALGPPSGPAQYHTRNIQLSWVQTSEETLKIQHSPQVQTLTQRQLFNTGLSSDRPF